MSHQPCKCGSTAVDQVRIHEGPHYAAEICAGCRRHLRWLPKPADKRTRRPAGHRHLVARHSRGFCELCRRRESELPAGQVLEGHHVDEYQHGGSADRQNVWIVCTACAKLIHWARHYFAGNNGTR